jgi:virginiamycin B lyase
MKEACAMHCTARPSPRALAALLASLVLASLLSGCGPAAHGPFVPVLTGKITEFPLPTIQSDPNGIALGADGNLWFTEDYIGQIGRITPAGKITEFPLPSSNADAEATGIAAGPDGNLWFTWGSNVDCGIGRSTTAGKITEFDLPSTGAGHECANEITSGPDGNLWFSVTNVGVGRITPRGQITLFPVPSAPTLDPTGITAGPDGAIWFTEPLDSGQGPGKIGHITPQGTMSEFAPSDLDDPQEITLGPDGNLWILDKVADTVGRLTPSGKYTVVASLQLGNGQGAITAGPDGNVWFTEPATNTVARITPGGVLTEFTPPNVQNSRPVDITKGPGDTVWFTDNGTNAIGRLG